MIFSEFKSENNILNKTVEYNRRKILNSRILNK